jgi:hypothetical protein
MWRKFAVWSGKQSKYIKICFCLLAIANHPVKQENPSFTNITASLDNCHFIWLGWLFQKEISYHLQYLEPYTKWLAVQSLLQTNEVPVGWQAWQAVKPPGSRPASSPPHGLCRTSESSDKRTYFDLKQIERNHSWQFKKVLWLPKVLVPLNTKGKNFTWRRLSIRARPK